MDRHDLFAAVGEADEELLARSEKKRRVRPVWFGAVAAVLAIAIVLSVLWQPGSTPGEPSQPSVSPSGSTSLDPHNSEAARVYALAECQYPQLPQVPTVDSPTFSEDLRAWQESISELRRPIDGRGGLDTFTAAVLGQLLSGGAENRVCSPMNVYMALAMLCELTGGESRRQLLDLLGPDSLEALRDQAAAVWRSTYRNDGQTTQVLGSSLWLDENTALPQDILNALAEVYYASTYRGQMGDPAYTAALRDWMNAQTGGLLEDQIGGLELKPGQVLSLVSTVCCQARWSQGFDPEETAQGTFHSPDGDVTADFMRREGFDHYYWGSHFSAACLGTDGAGGTMLLILPDKGVDVRELLTDGEVLDFIRGRSSWSKSKYVRLKLAVPRFDISCRQDLREDLRALGVTEVFDPGRADLAVSGAWVDQVLHGVRVAVDEEGITAAAYVDLAMDTMAAPPNRTAELILDRPFLFVYTTDSGLPLFAGIVNTP